MAITNEQAWDYAIGIVQIDGIKPSKEFLELVEKEKRGEMTGDDIRRVLCKKYKVKDQDNDWSIFVSWLYKIVKDSLERGQELEKQKEQR